LTIVMALAGTVILAYLVKAVIGLRPASDSEEMGLDDSDHGEAGYHFDEAGG
jgi:Amt family ammonium transporter